MSDTEIMSLYQETVGETGVSLDNVNSDSLYQEFTAEEATYTYQSLQNLSAAEIRDLMLSVGIDQNTLGSVDDETLIAIYEEALVEQVSAYSSSE